MAPPDSGIRSKPDLAHDNGPLVRRRVPGACFLFVLNHNKETVEVEKEGRMRDLLTGAEHAGRLPLEPLGVAVLRER